MISPNQRFGNWITKTHDQHYDKHGWKIDGWVCECQCPEKTTRWVRSRSLNEGTSRSCGCLGKNALSASMTKHGMSKTREYKAYHSMMQRCYNEKHDSYKYYGGRPENPIAVCESWQSFEGFMRDAASLPGYVQGIKGLTLDRIDPNMDYSPLNCRWSSNIEQQNNKRNNVNVVYNGTKMTLAEIARCEKIRYSRLANIYSWHKDSLTIEEIVAKAKVRKQYNLAEIARTHNVDYAKLYHLHVTKGFSLEEAIDKLVNQIR